MSQRLWHTGSPARGERDGMKAMRDDVRSGLPCPKPGSKSSTPRTHQVNPAPMDIAGMKKGEIMLIPTPKIIDAFIAKIPRGQSMDVKTFRQDSRRYKAEVTCPITTGFHLRAVAEVALEKLKGGAELTEITPFWRCWMKVAPTTARLSCGVTFVKKQRKAEGILAPRAQFPLILRSPGVGQSRRQGVWKDAGPARKSQPGEAVRAHQADTSGFIPRSANPLAQVG